MATCETARSTPIWRLCAPSRATSRLEPRGRTLRICWSSGPFSGPSLPVYHLIGRKIWCTHTHIHTIAAKGREHCFGLAFVFSLSSPTLTGSCVSICLTPSKHISFLLFSLHFPFSLSVLLHLNKINPTSPYLRVPSVPINHNVHTCCHTTNI